MIIKYLLLSITILIQLCSPFRIDQFESIDLDEATKSPNNNVHRNHYSTYLIQTTNDPSLNTTNSPTLSSTNLITYPSYRSVANSTGVLHSIEINKNKSFSLTKSARVSSYCPVNCSCLALENFEGKHNDSELNLFHNCLYLNLTRSTNLNNSNNDQFQLYKQFHPFQLQQLNELNLNFNNLSEPNNNLVFNAGHNQTISKLSLSHNRLSKFPKLRSLANSLKYLNLDHNRIVRLGEKGNRSVDVFRNLIGLNLNHNRIKLIRRSFLKEICSQLKYLDLSSNKLNKIDDYSFQHCKQLELIKLNRNFLLRIGSNAFENLSNLVELDLSRNNLTNLTIDFKSLINLRILDLSRNKLVSIDSTFEALTNLQTLNLNENNLIQLNAELMKGLFNLRLLQLSNNRIKRINVNWIDNGNLVNLYLEHNQIELIDSNTFAGLSNLEKLYLDYNQIEQIEVNAFQTNRNLIWLFLNDNYLDKLAAKNRTLFIHHRLQYLALENNHLTYLPNQLFVNLTTLVTIDLSLNQLQYIEENALRPLNKLDELNFDSTELNCDCRLKWFANYYQEKSIENIYLEHLECRQPKNLVNKSFVDVAIDRFLCEDDFRHYFVREPKKQLILREGQQFELKCKVVTNSLINEDIVFEWRKNNSTLLLNNERNIVEIMKLNKDKDYSLNHKLIYSSYLHFLNASSNDEGQYECLANNSYGSIRSQVAHVEISRPPELISYGNENYLKVQLGEDIRIDCRASKDPLPEISLNKNGHNFNLSIRHRIQFDRVRQQFIIKNATMDDRGFFTCIDKLGRPIRNITVVILYEPNLDRSAIQLTHDSEYVDDIQSILINCTMKSNSKSEIIVYKDKILLENSNDRYYLKSDSQILVIKDGVNFNTGLYRCVLKKRKDSDQWTTQQIELNYLYENWHLLILLIVIVCLICSMKIFLICLLKKLINQFFGSSKEQKKIDNTSKRAVKILNNGQFEANFLNEQNDTLLIKHKDDSSEISSPKYLSRNSLKNEPEMVTKLISYNKVQNSLENIARFSTNHVKLPVAKKVQFKLEN